MQTFGEAQSAVPKVLQIIRVEANNSTQSYYFHLASQAPQHLVHKKIKSTKTLCSHPYKKLRWNMQCKAVFRHACVQHLQIRQLAKSSRKCSMSHLRQGLMWATLAHEQEEVNWRVTKTLKIAFVHYYTQFGLTFDVQAFKLAL